MATLSIIIITKNEAHIIEPALKTCQFADELLVVDTDSSDKTVDIARVYADKIIKNSIPMNFSLWRNDGAKAAKGDWLLYLDADERIPYKLAQEILQTINNNPEHQAYTIPRYEVLLGAHLSHWPHSRVLRLIKKSALKKWHGKLHEQPEIIGSIGKIKNQMIHLTHRNFTDKILKTCSWSQLEANMLLKSNHPQMVGWRFFRIMATEFFARFFKQGLWHDGTEGVLESIYQTFSKFISYARLWELQRKPSLTKTYQQIDEQILKQWPKKN